MASRRSSRSLFPPGAKDKRAEWEGKEVGFQRHRAAHRATLSPLSPARRGQLRNGSVARPVMVEHTCPDCNGSRLRSTRLCFTIGGKTLFDVGQLHFDELHAFLRTMKPSGPRRRRGTPDRSRDRRAARAAARHRARLSELQSSLGNAFRRRIAAHPAVDADRLGSHGHALRARRAEHRAASQGQREDDRDARAACATSATR